MDGVGEDLLHRALLHNLASVHDGDGVGDLGDERQVVAHEHHGEAELVLQLVQQVDDLLLHRYVKSGGGLVCDDQLRVARQGHGDEHALALAAGELVGIGIQRALRVQADQLEQLLGGTGAATFGQLLHLRADEHGGVERGQGVLVDHGDLAAAQLVHLLVGEVEQVLAVVHDLAGDLGLLVEQAHDGQAGDGLAAAGLAHKAHGLARTHHEADMVDHVHVAMAGELDAQVLDFQDGRYVGAGLEAVGARKLGFLKGGKALVEHVGLSGIGQRRVGDHAVGLAVLIEVVLVDLDGALRRGDGVGDAFGDDVEAQNGQHDHDAGEQRLPPAAGQHAVTGVG